jgi:hypothetical protein
MILRLYGPPRVEFFVRRKRRRPYAVRVVLGMIRHRREFSTWTQALKYAYGLPHFREYRSGVLPPGNYVFFI